MSVNSLQLLAELFDDILSSHRGWRQNEALSQIRRSIPEYARGFWDLAMPFNQGPSELSRDHQQRFRLLRELMIDEKSVDVGHVITCIDVSQSFDIIEDVHASWAGDLGSLALNNSTRNEKLLAGAVGSSAGMPDLLGDIDGDNIANHMAEGHELDAIIHYYVSTGRYTGGVSVDNRFRTFASDLAMLDLESRQWTQAPAAVFAEHIDSFIGWYRLRFQMKQPLIFIQDLLDGEDDDLDLHASVEATAQQFADILIAGVRDEQNKSA